MATGQRLHRREWVAVPHQWPLDRRPASDDAAGRLPDDSAAGAAGIKTKIGNHTPRATGITDYRKSNGTQEHVQQIAIHSSPRTTKPYDWHDDEAPLNEYEKVGIW
jgi:hypothetical protein